MVQPVTLKKRHTLKGVSLLPVIRMVKEGDERNLNEFARISDRKKTESLSAEEIEKAVLEITGEPLHNILELAGKNGQDLDAARLVLHYSILQANEWGQPRGQYLEEAGSAQLPCVASSLTPQLVKVADDESDAVKKRGKIKDAERQLLSLEKEDVVKVKEVNEKDNYKPLWTSYGDSFDVPEFERAFDFDQVNVRTEESSMTNSWETDSFDTFTDGDYDSDDFLPL